MPPTHDGYYLSLSLFTPPGPNQTLGEYDLFSLSFSVLSKFSPSIISLYSLSLSPCVSEPTVRKGYLSSERGDFLENISGKGRYLMLYLILVSWISKAKERPLPLSGDILSDA